MSGSSSQLPSQLRGWDTDGLTFVVEKNQVATAWYIRRWFLSHPGINFHHNWVFLHRPSIKHSNTHPIGGVRIVVEIYCPHLRTRISEVGRYLAIKACGSFWVGPFSSRLKTRNGRPLPLLAGSMRSRIINGAIIGQWGIFLELN